MARRSQCSSAGDNPLDPNYLPPHYREEYRLAIDALVEEDLDGYYQFLQNVDVVDFLSEPEIRHIQSSVQAPELISQPELPYLDSGGDGSSDTYWPVHSDLDVPGLDLGWPQMHPFMEPTEVTTLINPPEPDMPSIKEQARRLIKNAQQVIAVAMDIFTDVDMFSDILNAASRGVAVYILLDEQNVHHFVNMVVNCRVNLQSFPCLRVRTVCGITYQCRSGKSFKGQMLDRFLLTDCRAVLSGNYSFMWSYEKLHRCMAHLFLGQLVATFDEEFRILFAQSQPLIVENILAQMEDVRTLQKGQYPIDSTSLYREPRKFLPQHTGLPDKYGRHPQEERIDGDWRMGLSNRQESLRGPVDISNRFYTHQPHMEPGFDQVPPRILMTENPALKRHSYAEGVQGRYHFMQGMLEPEPKGKLLYRGQQPYPGPEQDYSNYDKFWNQEYLSPDQFSEPALPQAALPSENYESVLKYLSSTNNVEFETSSEKLLPLPFSSPEPKRRGIGQPYICQTSPTPSTSADQNPFFQDSSINRKDPHVKQKLRNWRIGSYLSAYEEPEEEGLPYATPLATDAFVELPNPTKPAGFGIDMPIPKMPTNIEFKVPAIPRASQLPSYAKTTTKEKPKIVINEPISVPAEPKITPTPSESSSTTDGDKVEETDQKPPKTSLLLREDSTRRKNVIPLKRHSRLISSMLFSSLELQSSQESTSGDQCDEESGNKQPEDKHTKLPFAAQFLGQRKSSTNQPIEWSRFLKSATETPKADDESSKTDDKDSSKEENVPENVEAQKSSEPSDSEQVDLSTSVPPSKAIEGEPLKTVQNVVPNNPLLTSPYVDMSDPDKRFMFFKQLAAQRKAAKAAEAAESEKKNERSLNAEDTPGAERQAEYDPAEKTGLEGKCDSTSPSLKLCQNASKKDSSVRSDSSTTKTSCELETGHVASLSVSAEGPEEVAEPKPTVKDGQLPSMQPLAPTPMEPPKTDQLAPLSKYSLTNLSCLDMSDPDKRFLYFKELAAHRKAEAEKTKAESKEKDLKSSPGLQPKQPLGISSQSVKASMPDGSSTTVTDAKNPGETKSIESSTPPSSTLDGGENISRKDRLFKNDSKSSQTVTGQPKLSAETTELDRKSSISFSTEREAYQSKSSKDSTEGLNTRDEHDTDESSLAQSPSPALESTSVESSSVPLSSCSSASTPSPLATDPVSLESNIHFPLSSSEPATGSESSAPLLTSASQSNSSKVEEALLSDVQPKVSSPTLPSNVLSLNTDATEAQDSQPEETSQPAQEALEKCGDQHNQTPQNTGSSLVSEESSSNIEKETISEECASPESSKDADTEGLPPLIRLSASESNSPMGSALESSASKHDLSQAPAPVATPEDSRAEGLASGKVSLENTDSLFEPSASVEDKPMQTASLENLADFNSTTGAQTQTSSSTFGPEQAEKTPGTEKSESDSSAVDCVPETDSVSGETRPESEESQTDRTSQTLSPSCPASPAPAEADLLCKTPETVTPESQTSEPSVAQESKQEEVELVDTADKNSENLQDTDKSQKTGSQETTVEKTAEHEKQNSSSEPTETTSKQPKSNQSRYHSSTVNVLSSSNLRDDTKLLLEQISANCQSRSEATKESPVTDDEKEDKAEKLIKADGKGRFGRLGKGQTKSTEERENLLQRIQSMRKDKKVYSRFEMAS